MDDELRYLASQCGKALQDQKLMLVTAESCTGGWVGEAVTAIPGSSKWYERGFITYTNLSKQEMLGVKPQTLQNYGAVSEHTVLQMADGALKHSHAQVAVATSGIAGPGGGSEAKPVGTICIAIVIKDKIRWVNTFQFDGDREVVRQQAVKTVLLQLVTLLSE
ncbi:MAG: nicotinamide-nucleotide amidase [Gammaproteobacteria bacterium]|nr:MAG: nicotinamide-nucleotide amidase [Gammaproteobacteria bacterium]